MLARLADDTLRGSLPLFLPELVVVATIVLLLLGRVSGFDRLIGPAVVALVGSATACGVAVMQLDAMFAAGRTDAPLFSGLLSCTYVGVYVKVLAAAAAAFTVLLTGTTKLPDREDGPDYYTMLLGVTLGAMLTASAEHLLMVVVAIEMMSVPGYVLVGFQKGRAKSGEAALKYLVFGSGASGTMLYGTSLIAGTLGTASLDEIGVVLAAGTLPAGGTAVSLGVLFLTAGVAFKLSLVPFHFWSPDAYEGAPAEAAGFLSVAPKVAAFVVLVRLVEMLPADAAAGSGLIDTPRFGMLLAGLSAASMTLGNLGAFFQRDLKRLLAYSSISHAGYLTMGVVAFACAGDRQGLSGLLYYSAAYVAMNLGLFAVVAVVRRLTRGESVDAVAGIGTRKPVLGLAAVVCAVGLIGLPPTGGFIGKIAVFAATYAAGLNGSAAVTPWCWGLLACAGVNTVLGLFVYLRIVKAMYFEPYDGPADLPRVHPVEVGCLLLALAAVVATGVTIAPLSAVTDAAVGVSTP